MHGVRQELVELQAQRMDLPLWPVELPWPCSNAEYEERCTEVWHRALQQGFHAVAFGDLFLADIRAYRVRQLAGSGLEPLFPLWNIPTGELAREMLQGGLKAIVTCVDPRHLNRSFAGRDFDEAFLRDLPPGVDPCGENGEFHTFVSDGPQFSTSIAVSAGEVVQRDGFVFADLLGR